jgi:hypothetical protein
MSIEKCVDEMRCGATQLPKNLGFAEETANHAERISSGDGTGGITISGPTVLSTARRGRKDVPQGLKRLRENAK